MRRPHGMLADGWKEYDKSNWEKYDWMNKMNQVFVGGEKNAIFANRFFGKKKRGSFNEISETEWKALLTKNPLSFGFHYELT